jgi:hypothetical protein
MQERRRHPSWGRQEPWLATARTVEQALVARDQEHARQRTLYEQAWAKLTPDERRAIGLSPP